MVSNFGNSLSLSEYGNILATTNYGNNSTYIYYNPDPLPPTPPSLVCFKEDSKILTDNGYIPVQQLRKGDRIKTINNDYVPINMIGFKKIHHKCNPKRIKDQLYKLCSADYPELTEELVITGCHSILVDNISNEQGVMITEMLDRVYTTDGKFRLPACLDTRASPYEKAGTYTIYHIALENENYHGNYGVYANGLLVETCSKRYLAELSEMTLLD